MGGGERFARPGAAAERGVEQRRPRRRRRRRWRPASRRPRTAAGSRGPQAPAGATSQANRPPAGRFAHGHAAPLRGMEEVAGGIAYREPRGEVPVAAVQRRASSTRVRWEHGPSHFEGHSAEAPRGAGVDNGALQRVRDGGTLPADGETKVGEFPLPAARRRDGGRSGGLGNKRGPGGCDPSGDALDGGLPAFELRTQAPR
mmetsp:Transcript_57633/g.166888  ORF Transcript_57633/g.166888 Transcript_57633/m.166888 type:complete len:201 (+) Transcript_57633:549-1151(+)